MSKGWGIPTIYLVKVILCLVHSCTSYEWSKIVYILRAPRPPRTAALWRAFPTLIYRTHSSPERNRWVLATGYLISKVLVKYPLLQLYSFQVPLYQDKKHYRYQVLLLKELDFRNSYYCAYLTNTKVMKALTRFQ